MLPDDPVLRGRLFRAARSLLGWTQARLACEAGVPTGTVAAVEVGRRGECAAVLPTILGALERSGVRVVVSSDRAHLRARDHPDGARVPLRPEWAGREHRGRRAPAGQMRLPVRRQARVVHEAGRRRTPDAGRRTPDAGRGPLAAEAAPPQPCRSLHPEAS
jgi:transcriptional regulator with XRE-family HTH domain